MGWRRQAEEASVRNDVMVIGGGPAGLTAAIALRLRGFDVTVVDAGHPPIDKACGEGIMPAGVAALERLGVRLAGAAGFPFRGIRFRSGGTAVEGGFRDGCGVAIRRTLLHQILIDRAGQLGVRLRWERHVRDISGLASSGWIVGADGENSQVRRGAGLEAAGNESHRFGFRRHYRIPPWTDFVEVHWGRRCQISVTPVSEGEVGVALLTRDSRLRLNAALAEFPELESRLRRADRRSTERGSVTFSRRLRQVWRGNVVLAGDASGSVDAIAGEGLSLAFQQAGALAEALCSSDPAAYQVMHSRLAQRPEFFSRLLLLLDQWPALRRISFGALAQQPWIFAKALNVQSPVVAVSGVRMTNRMTSQKTGADCYAAIRE